MNKPRKTPIPGAPVLPKGYFYRVWTRAPHSKSMDGYFAHVQVRRYIGLGVSIKCGEDSAYGDDYTPANIQKAAREANKEAFKRVRESYKLPASVADYIGDHRA
jgi:hypothetical protein